MALKCVPYRVNGRNGRAYIVVREQLVPMLKQQKILTDNETLEVDWDNNGNYKRIWWKTAYVTCPFCSSSTKITGEDLGFDEFECPDCESMFAIPETFEELEKMNEEIKNNTQAHVHSHYRAMLRGEDGELSCLKNGIPVEYIDIMIAGYQANYPEGHVFKEPEETYADLLRANRFDM